MRTFNKFWTYESAQIICSLRRGWHRWHWALIQAAIKQSHALSQSVFWSYTCVSAAVYAPNTNSHRPAKLASSAATADKLLKLQCPASEWAPWCCHFCWHWQHCHGLWASTMKWWPPDHQEVKINAFQVGFRFFLDVFFSLPLGWPTARCWEVSFKWWRIQELWELLTTLSDLRLSLHSSMRRSIFLLDWLFSSSVSRFCIIRYLLTKRLLKVVFSSRLIASISRLFFSWGF